MGIMEKNMETTILAYIGFRVQCMFTFSGTSCPRRLLEALKSAVYKNWEGSADGRFTTSDQIQAKCSASSRNR